LIPSPPDDEKTVGVFRSIQALDPSYAKNAAQLANALRLGAGG